MEDFRKRREEEQGDDATAARVEEWLSGLRAQRAAGGSPRGPAGDTAGRAGRSGASSPSDDPAEAFLKAARRLAASPRAQEALARRLAAGEAAAQDPALRSLARVLEALGKELSGVLGSGSPAPAAPAAPGGSAATLERPDVVEERLADDEGGGGDDDIDDDDDDGGDDEGEPWPSAFVGYRVGLVKAVDVGTCRDGCCTAVFVDHPQLRAAVWFPTEAAATLAGNISGALDRQRGQAADLGVQPFSVGEPPAQGQMQATIQFFTDDVHLDPADDASPNPVDGPAGGFARLMAFDQSLGHGGPPLVDAWLDVAQARALRRGLRRAARNFTRQAE